MMQKRTLVVGVAAVLGLALAGCGATTMPAETLPGNSTVSPAHPIKPVIPSPVAIARSQANTLLATIMLPSDAVAQTDAPDGAADAPYEKIACDPTVDVDSFAVIHDVSLQDAANEVSTAEGSSVSGTGHLTSGSADTERGVSLTTTDASSQLTVTLTSVAGGGVALRLDAVVAERGAACQTSGSGVTGAARSTSSPSN